MKHTIKITILLAVIYFVTQVIGLAVTNQYIETQETIDPDTNEIMIELVPKDLPYNLERPEIEESTSYVWILFAIIFGTILLLVIMKYKKMNLWKLWFFFAVFFTMMIAFAAFMNQISAALLAFFLAILKIYRPTTIIQNVTEIFIYGGLAAIFVPVLTISAIFILLILISIYDIIAVRHTKHMVKLAKFQTKSKVFAGLMIPYSRGKGKIVMKEDKKHGKNTMGRVAVLGGGDMGFPLLFAGVVMKNLMLTNTVLIGFLKTLMIPVFVTGALLYLLFKGESNKFYPAMPYLTVGCFLGYVSLLLF